MASVSGIGIKLPARLSRHYMWAPYLLLVAIVAARIWPSLMHYPDSWVVRFDVELDEWLKSIVNGWRVAGISIADMTRAISAALAYPIDFTIQILTEGAYISTEWAGEFDLPPLPWTITAAVLILVSWRIASWKQSLLVAAVLSYVVLFGLWESTFTTLVGILFAVTLSGCGGLLLGIACNRYRKLSAVMEPIYDLLQTVPIFSYLTIILLFFGFGQISALVATILFAMPPMARATELALAQTPHTMEELAQMTGCTSVQRLLWVKLPVARQELLIGLNQVTMLSLSMVIVASIIGAGGLGGDVLRGLKSMQLTQALISGFAISLIAIAIDRTMRAWSHGLVSKTIGRRRFLLIAAVILGGCLAASFFSDALRYPPLDPIVDPGRLFDDAVAEVNRQTQASLTILQGWFVGIIQIPFRNLIAALPWFPATIAVAILGILLGNVLRGVILGALIASLAILGLWDKAMLSLYMVVLSLVIAAIIGFPLGLYIGTNRRAFSAMEAVADVIQTLPTFVYLIPVVVLFGAGDFPALVAIVGYLLAPIIRYTASGIRYVPESLIDAADMLGCTATQKLLLVRLPVGLPQIMLGLNQAVMLGFGMLVITALVGSRGLEELTLIAVAQVRPGFGLIAGYGIAVLAIVTDRLLRGASLRLRQQATFS